MSDGARLVRAWRQRRKEQGFKSVLIWLTPEEKHMLELQAVQYQQDFGRVVGRLLTQAQTNGAAMPQALVTPPAKKRRAVVLPKNPTAKAPRLSGSRRETLKKSAEARAKYPKLGLSKFVRVLFDRNIYRSKDRKTKEEKPLDTGTLARWLEEAREHRLL
jgi:hypothetical protein